MGWVVLELVAVVSPVVDSWPVADSWPVVGVSPVEDGSVGAPVDVPVGSSVVVVPAVVPVEPASVSAPAGVEQAPSTRIWATSEIGKKEARRRVLRRVMAAFMGVW